MKPLNIAKSLVILLLTFSVSCSDLSVSNLNEPDTERALASETDLRSLANGLFRQWYINIHSYNAAQMALGTASDAMTCSWGNQGMQDMGTEPRIPWDNAPNYPYAGVTSFTFDNMYAINSSATDVLKAMEDGVQFGDNGSDNATYRALAKFAQGLSMGYIGLIFDQAYIVDETTTEEEILNPTLVPYTDIMDHAVSKLEDVVSITNSNSFTLDEGVISTDRVVNATVLGQLAHSFIARFLSYAPRNASQNEQVDWAAVKSHAQNGVDYDFVIQADGKAPWEGSEWYNEGLVYLVYPGWGRVDLRVINMMDDNYPAHTEDDTDYPAPVESEVEDERLLTDFEYLSSNNFRSERGYYHFSNFRFSRMDEYIGSFDIQIPEIMKAEVDLLLAEAHMHLGEYTQAASIINNGPRVTRGNMDPIAPNEQAIKDAIHHERMVETLLTGVGNEYFEMRKNDLLQEGTILHFPLPAKILEILGKPKPFYTFGGVANADGVNTSDGGWR